MGDWQRGGLHLGRQVLDGVADLRDLLRGQAGALADVRGVVEFVVDVADVVEVGAEDDGRAGGFLVEAAERHALERHQREVVGEESPGCADRQRAHIAVAGHVAAGAAAVPQALDGDAAIQAAQLRVGEVAGVVEHKRVEAVGVAALDQQRLQVAALVDLKERQLLEVPATAFALDSAASRGCPCSS